MAKSDLTRLSGNNGVSETTSFRSAYRQDYGRLIHSPAFKEEPRYTLSVEIMSGSYLDGKIVDELRLPERCVIINVHRDRKNLPPKGQTLMPGDQVQIEMDSQDIEKLYEPLVSMANIY